MCTCSGSSRAVESHLAESVRTWLSIYSIMRLSYSTRFPGTSPDELESISDLTRLLFALSSPLCRGDAVHLTVFDYVYPDAIVGCTMYCMFAQVHRRPILVLRVQSWMVPWKKKHGGGGGGKGLVFLKMEPWRTPAPLADQRAISADLWADP